MRPMSCDTYSGSEGNLSTEDEFDVTEPSVIKRQASVGVERDLAQHVQFAFAPAERCAQSRLLMANEQRLK